MLYWDEDRELANRINQTLSNVFQLLCTQAKQINDLESAVEELTQFVKKLTAPQKPLKRKRRTAAEVKAAKEFAERLKAETPVNVDGWPI
jgi:uncharacterized coiled-coil DUF342 family protein